MKVILDTQVLLWALIEPDRLPATSRAMIESAGNDMLFSAASVWEIAIKSALGRADFGVRPEEILEGALASGFTELPVRASATLRVARLPLHHRDPFDRLLVAQAMEEPANLHTADRQLTAYSELVQLI